VPDDNDKEHMSEQTVYISNQKAAVILIKLHLLKALTNITNLMFLHIETEILHIDLWKTLIQTVVAS
jgi:hypothetical protein